jgi:hypothetical protein
MFINLFSLDQIYMTSNNSREATLSKALGEIFGEILNETSAREPTIDCRVDRTPDRAGKNIIIFCDLDGVLADFEQGVIDKFKKPPEQLKPGVMWGVINKSNTFFENLPWMPEGRKLWEQIKQYNPIILTGIPNSGSAAEQKRRWCARELGEHINVITCATKDKPKYCIKNSILIDDRSDNMNAWNTKGGTFILYDEEFVDEIIERIKTI